MKQNLETLRIKKMVERDLRNCDKIYSDDGVKILIVKRYKDRLVLEAETPEGWWIYHYFYNRNDYLDRQRGFKLSKADNHNGDMNYVEILSDKKVY